MNHPVRVPVQVAQPPAVDGVRLLRRLDELGLIGADGSGGVTRPAFSEPDRHAQRYLRDEASRAGLAAEVDPAGNLIFRRHGADATSPCLLMGSHIDTVTNGGRFDGAYGVVAALEVLQCLAECNGSLTSEVAVIAFANEEGALFPHPFWGSLAVTGQFERMPDEPIDRLGRSLREPLRLAGGNLDALHDAEWPRNSITAYLELHVEQGPVLETSSVPIGVVEAIVGRTVLDIDVRGRAGHAGTTPMDCRLDALTTASHIVLAADEVARTGKCRVATTGRLAVWPDVTNVVPGRVTATVELRDADENRLSAAEGAFRREARSIEQSTRCAINVECVMRIPPVATSTRLREAIRAAAAEIGLRSIQLPSGAGHDAQVVATRAPVGMIFVPSRNGISHVPEEYTAPDELIAGAEVLLRTAWRIVN